MGKRLHTNSQMGPSQAHSGDHLHLPLKEYELPTFLSENGQARRSSPGGSPVIQRHLGDIDVEVSPEHSPQPGLMIPPEQLKMPDFLRQSSADTEQEKHKRRLQIEQAQKSEKTSNATGAKPKFAPKEHIHQRPNNSKPHHRHRTAYVVPAKSRPKGHTGRIVFEITDNEMWQDSKKLEGKHFLSNDSLHEQEILPHRTDNSQMASQRYNQQQEASSAWSKAQMSVVADDMNAQLKLDQTPPSFQAPKTNGHLKAQGNDHLGETSLDNSNLSAGFGDSSLQRKYKRRDWMTNNKQLHQYPQEPQIIVKTPTSHQNGLAGVEANDHIALTDTDSLQSNSSHSFSHSYSHPSSRTENHTWSNQDRLSVRVTASDRFSPRVSSVNNGDKDFALKSEETDSASPGSISVRKPRVLSSDKSLGYINSSVDDDSSNKVKRTNSLQAQLRSKIKKYEATRDFEGHKHRERLDSDSTTISETSFFSDGLPSCLPRKSAVKMHSINELPEELLMKILNYLPTSELCKSSGVCRKWQYLCWDPELWRRITILNYQDSNINRVLKNLLSKLAMRTQGYCLTVQSVKLNGCELLSDKALGFIARFCIDIEELEIVGCCCITSKGLQDILTSCHNLCSLDLTGCSCVNSVSAPMTNGFSLGDRGSFLQLRHLNLSDCVAFDDLGLRTVGLRCGLLENLYLRRCNRVTDVGIKHVANHCLVLKELSVSDCYKVRDFSLKEVSRHISGLKYLSVAKCPVTDAGVKCIGKRCVRLKYLNVRGCEGVSDVGIVHVVQNCLKLRSLDIGKCSITDSALQTIGIHCPQLKKLSLKGCAGISDTGVKSVAAQCCSLQYLNVQECNLDYETFAYIREHCRNCIIEHTCPAFF